MLPSRPSPPGWKAPDRSQAMWDATEALLTARPTSGSTCAGGEPSAKRKIGRPRSDKPRPWDGTGLSKSDYYRKKSKGEV
jgi:hypothetical protein